MYVHPLSPPNNTITTDATAVNSASCANLGGFCQFHPFCAALVVRRQCPGDDRCCVDPEGVDVDDITRHINVAEGGLYLEG